MRYGDGGGVDQAGRVRREQVRHRAAAMFDAGMHPTEVAAALEVSTKSGYQWHRAWKNAGAQASASKGPPGPARKLSQAQVRRLQAELNQGAVAAGHDDQQWTLARVAALIRTLLHRTVSVQTVSVLSRRMGWSPQLPKHQARERDEAAITHWRRHQRPAIKGSHAGWARSSASKTSPVSH